MAILDIILLICFIPGIVSGISKGFVKQVVDLVAILVAAWSAFHFSTPLGEWLSQYISLEDNVLKIISFVLIAVVAALLLNLVAKLITNAMKALSLGFINRLLGLVFAILKVALILGILILVFETLNGTFHFVDESFADNTVVYRFLRNAVERIFPIIKTYVSGGADPAAAATVPDAI